MEVMASSTPKDQGENGKPPSPLSAMAFTVNFDEQNVRQLKIHDKLSSFALKHRRNPSLPDFRLVKSAKSPEETEQRSLPIQSVSGIPSYNTSDGYYFCDQDDELAKKRNNMENSLPRRSSMVEILPPSNLDETFTKDDSDTVSEAGTYTVNKDEDEFLNVSNLDESKNSISYTPENHKWINDWISKVAEENFSKTRPVSPVATKNLRPISPNQPKIRDSLAKPANCLAAKVNGAHHHRRSSSLSVKDIQENRKSDGSLETESFLKATESVVNAMQNRMKLENSSMKTSRVKERPHPPSTASDTDTNSENDHNWGNKSKILQPFSSARLNRAFRRARVDAEEEKKKPIEQKPKLVMKVVEKMFGDNVKKPLAPVRPAANAQVQPKTQKKANGPFTRVDGGRYSMRALPTITKSSTPSAVIIKREQPSKKSTGGNRSNSTLSAREVEFQNWKRRKSFDPMKAAAEGRKKEMAKKAALSGSMTQSVTVAGSSVHMQSELNPVLRSASFHSSIFNQGLESEEQDDDYYYDDLSPEEPIVAERITLPPSPTRQPNPYKTILNRASGSRTSLNSAMSSPTRQVRSELLDNLVLSAISDLSYKLKIKSCHLLRKLNALYGEEDESRAEKFRESIQTLENERRSANSSPRKSTKDFSAILKNLKAIENAFNVMDDVLFEENIELYVD